MQRLRPQGSAFVAKKKNVRTKDLQANEAKDANIKDDEKATKFNKLVQITTRLQQLGFTEVFSEKKGDLAYEVKQHDIKVEREKARVAREVLGWYYKIMNKASGQESEPYGPFTQEEMATWNDGGFFNESEEQFCTFEKV